ncbi:hypothetical protein QBC47DRAFT_455132 [Echria macrotheca]|uniref:TM7S3/TM198-like domain-containing protein n=1 Tax=Echria macrotheca TaxID=438768 RepID=A0AAJ0B2Z2_9PEZI|nr:hypothetical protein QBC47DRAFT_455132 [Echria macrotheca]
MKSFTFRHVGIVLSLWLLSSPVLAKPGLVRRQEPSLSTTGPTSTIPPAALLSTTLSTTTSPPSSSLQSTSTSAAASTTTSLDIASLSSPVPEGELPLEPVITPGWAVAGIILLLTGVVHALVGIKTKWLHAFFSTAFLTGLSTTVLIVYVMTLPVSNAIQGAYVVAVVCTGAVLGGMAVVFKEVTECLGCLLGGFCLSMWLLALQPGGLITGTGGKVGLIAAFTLAAFGLYFIKWTRTYGLIACISFSGATAAVLGIDCFSRAGLKEFWAYIWHLNDNLFPLGVNTYPMTRGIRVELAATILIWVAGIVSQLRVWRIIKERRAKRDAELAEDARNLQIEEEAVGRQVEEATARERRRWERVYGDGSAVRLADSSDSGVGDMESEKRARHNSGPSVSVTSRPQSSTGIDVDDGPPAVRAATPLSLEKALAVAESIPKNEKDGAVTVGVSEEALESGEYEEHPKATGDVSGPVPRAESLRFAIPPVVPLPFRIPESPVDSDRSSLATIADEEDIDPRTEKRSSRVEVLARRLSNGSAKILRSLSQRSKTKAEVVAEPTREESDSVAAHLDDLSSVGDGPVTERWSYIDASPGIGKAQEDAPSPGVNAGKTGGSLESPNEVKPEDVMLPASPVVGEPSAFSKTATQKQGTSSGSTSATSRRKSAASVDSAAASLTMGNLPPALSRVALSYRTNEWAKHLSAAEAPELELPQFEEPVPDEAPAPVDVNDLQQTAENASLPPALTRSGSAVGLSRSSSKGSETTVSSAEPLVRSRRTMSGTLKGRSLELLSQVIAEEPSSETIPRPKPPHELPSSTSTPNLYPSATYSPPQTLIGMRETLMRNKTSYSYLVSSPAVDTLTPIPSRPSSDAGSLYNYTPPPQNIDLDDVPLSQRRALLRQSSFNLNKSNSLIPPPPPSAETTPFDSHQPPRKSHIPPETVRQVQLQNFRSSVAADLRQTNTRNESPFMLAAAGGSPSLANLRSSFRSSPSPYGGGGRGEDIDRTIERQRSLLLGRKEAEAQRREMERAEAVRTQREFEERMRSGVLMGAHRDALRRMQGGVRDL